MVLRGKTKTLNGDPDAQLERIRAFNRGELPLVTRRLPQNFERNFVYWRAGERWQVFEAVMLRSGDARLTMQLLDKKPRGGILLDGTSKIVFTCSGYRPVKCHVPVIKRDNGLVLDNAAFLKLFQELFGIEFTGDDIHSAFTQYESRLGKQ